MLGKNPSWWAPCWQSPELCHYGTEENLSGKPEIIEILVIFTIDSESYSESIENQWPFISLEVSVLVFLSSFTKYELHSFRQTWNYSHSSYRVSGILWLLPPVNCHLKQQSKSVWDSKKKLVFPLFTEATVTFLNSTHRMFFNIFNSDWKPNAIIKVQAKCYVGN